MSTIDKIKEYYGNARLELRSMKYNQLLHKIAVMRRLKGCHDCGFELNSHGGKTFVMIVKR